MTQTPDENAAPTEPLELADQQPLGAAESVPVQPATPAATGSSGSGRKVLVGVAAGVLGLGLLAAAGATGFVVGHATSDDGHSRLMSDQHGFADGPGDSQGMGQDQGMGQGMDPRGIDPDGDDWTGGGHRGPGDGQGMGQDQGMGQGMGQGMDPRGIDPDGDNWTGGGPMGGNQQGGDSAPSADPSGA